MAHDESRVYPPDDPSPQPAPWPPDVMCPVCGRVGLPFDVKLSALLDWFALFETMMQDGKKTAEDLVA
jgi:hypothetical protein